MAMATTTTAAAATTTTTTTITTTTTTTAAARNNNDTPRCHASCGLRTRHCRHCRTFDRTTPWCRCRFYTPDCHMCDVIDPEFEYAASKYDESDEMLFGRVNGYRER